LLQANRRRRAKEPCRPWRQQGKRGWTRTLQTDLIAVFMDKQLCGGAMHHQRDKEVSKMLWKVVGGWLLSFSPSHHGKEDMFVVLFSLFSLHRAAR
jgi:hypothetical protein